ncbi:hypothetical protein L915_13142, partial [Phytophthora nicotianae]
THKLAPALNFTEKERFSTRPKKYLGLVFAQTFKRRRTPEAGIRFELQTGNC